MLSATAPASAVGRPGLVTLDAEGVVRARLGQVANDLLAGSVHRQLQPVVGQSAQRPPEFVQ
jgi:hypothetical protein